MERRLFLTTFLCILVSCTAMPEISPSPVIIPTITSSPTLTFTPTPTIMPKPTQTATSTENPFASYNPYPQVVESPDGKLTAKIHYNWDNPTDKPVIEVWDQKDSIIFTIPFQYHWDPLLRLRGMSIHGWSPDSTKLYFYYSIHYDTGLLTLAYVRDLQSLDINTGEVEYILPLPTDEPTAFTFSAEMDEIAYISGNMVNILDLTTGLVKNTKILTDDSDDAGWIYYSPSGNKIIYHMLVSEDYFSIILEPKTLQQEIIYTWPVYRLVNYKFDGWTSNEYPRYLDFEKNVVIIDPSTHSQIKMGTPTP